MTEEQVLVIPTKCLPPELKEGVTEATPELLKILLDTSIQSFKPRSEMEKDENFRQLIPYCAFVYQDQVFVYQRTKMQGEERLHRNASIGIGGHVNIWDKGFATQPNPYFRGMFREVREEVGIILEKDYRTESSIVGIINDTSNEVGRVHLGFLHVFYLDKPEIHLAEKSMSISHGFVKVEDAIQILSGLEFESWSKLCLEFMSKKFGIHDPKMLLLFQHTHALPIGKNTTTKIKNEWDKNWQGTPANENSQIIHSGIDYAQSPFKVGTGLMGHTESGQIVTADNAHFLPPGSVVRLIDKEEDLKDPNDTWSAGVLIHLHDNYWYRYHSAGKSSESWCYDNLDRFKYLLPGVLCHHSGKQIE